MAEQRARSQEGGSFKVDYNEALQLDGSTQFTGYDSLSGSGTVTAIVRDGEQVDALGIDETGVIVLDNTPFYAESGGQVGDTGVISFGDAKFEVKDTIKLGGTFFGHIGRMNCGQHLKMAQGTHLHGSAVAIKCLPLIFQSLIYICKAIL